MRLRAVVLAAILLCFGASLAMADLVSANASFTGGVNGTWKFQYTSSAPGPDLESIAINLATTDLAFDTASGGFGYLSNLPVGNFRYSDPATTVTSTFGGADGGTWVLFNFSNFLPGDTFQFSADVDRTDSKYQPVSCASGLAGALCRLTNGANATTAELVGPNLMAGAEVTFTFGGGGGGDIGGYPTTTLTGTFQQVTFQEIIQGLVGGKGVDSFDTNADASAPEPASVATFGVGLGLILALRRRRA
jgi:hypothetical protein